MRPDKKTRLSPSTWIVLLPVVAGLLFSADLDEHVSLADQVVPPQGVADVSPQVPIQIPTPVGMQVILQNANKIGADGIHTEWENGQTTDASPRIVPLDDGFVAVNLPVHSSALGDATRTCLDLDHTQGGAVLVGPEDTPMNVGVDIDYNGEFGKTNAGMSPRWIQDKYGSYYFQAPQSSLGNTDRICVTFNKQDEAVKQGK